MSDIPTVSYDDIRARFKEDGIRLDDVHASLSHFAAWHQRNGLPDRDADGNAVDSSRIFMSMYDEAPDGRAQRPPYVNFWHWLVDTYKIVDWAQTSQERSKLVPLKRGMHHHRSPLSADEMKAAIVVLIGDIPLSGEMRESIDRHLSEDLSDQVVRHNECLKIVDAILNRHGDDILLRISV